MTDPDFTLTTPLPAALRNTDRLLALTIVWHPDPGRVGEQYVGHGDGDAAILALNRYTPLFCKPGLPGLPLGHGTITRDQLQIVRSQSDEVEVRPPSSRMVVELNGAVIEAAVTLTVADLEEGQLLGLGRTVLICLHWMDCLPKANPIPGLIGVGCAAIMLRDQIHMVAASATPVLLLGETGSGKEIVAHAIHALSARAQAAFVAVNMATLSESLAAADLFGAAKGAYTGAVSARKGWFGEAADATLFLDEVGNTPASVQPMLLRVLEGGDYRPLGAQRDCQSSARLIAATDQDLNGASFNPALLRRLENFVIHLPPLRARREDIGVLLLALQGTQAVNWPFELVSELALYDWPGNVRQFSNIVKRAQLSLRAGKQPSLHELAVREHVAARNPAPPALPVIPRSKPAKLSDQDVLEALDGNAWTIKAAASALGVSRPTMYKLIDAHTQIRRAELFSREELHGALAASDGNVQRCAALLKTPAEALRRQVRLLGLVSG